MAQRRMTKADTVMGSLPEGEAPPEKKADPNVQKDVARASQSKKANDAQKRKAMARWENEGGALSQESRKG